MAQHLEHTEVTQSKVVAYTCDVCKVKHNTASVPLRITTGHDGWANDSIDSIEHFDVCSLQCLVKGIKNGDIEYDEDQISTYMNIDGSLGVDAIEEIKRLD